MPSLTFLKSAETASQAPADDIPEVALVGRSNAGKSSLINAFANQKSLALVSQKPGKTRLLNFYSAGKYRWVDLPGYGFATRSKEEKQAWQGMVEDFLSMRGNLVGLLILVDIRRDWQTEETQLVRWWAQRQLPVGLVLTKADQLRPHEQLKREKEFSKIGVPFFVTSAEKKSGVAEVEDYIFSNWVKPSLGVP